ncbi:hypothetical protein G6W61_10295 [Streptomyces sp. KAI-26]|uniref:hypothetical protein n=1 Tax=Streptomyces sp. KAI-26 TaxID=1169747 RepID=UPI0015876503|nr:hypothetical protein [Streptomyces sp. KAI-26]NUV86597.1 hypothetical protein [Streptomyces sp. KAI-26]NUW21208.1 hypothetical protein [Streptomyces roseoviolaceus]
MAYATLDELRGRLDWEPDEDELRIAAGALDDASDLAATYGRDWPEDTAPRLVKTLVLKSAARYMRNPNGYTQSRAGDETLAWSDIGRDGGTVYFSREEIRLLEELAGRKRGITSVAVFAWGTKPGGRSVAGRVPVDYSPASPFPMFVDEAGPW